MFDKSVSLFTVSGRLITDDEIDLGQVYISSGINLKSTSYPRYFKKIQIVSHLYI